MSALVYILTVSIKHTCVRDVFSERPLNTDTDDTDSVGMSPWYPH